MARECDECDSPPEPACELFGTSDCSFKRSSTFALEWTAKTAVLSVAPPDSPALCVLRRTEEGNGKMIVNICRGADSRWSVYVDGRMVPISPCRQRRSAILLAERRATSTAKRCQPAQDGCKRGGDPMTISYDPAITRAQKSQALIFPGASQQGADGAAKTRAGRGKSGIAVPI